MTGNRRFAAVIHEEPGGGEHVDLFLEMDEALFSLKGERAGLLGDVWEARRQFDHRKRYLDYEGEISGNRGFVRLFDSGPMVGEVALEGAFEVELRGAHLRGVYRVEPVADGYRLIRLHRPD